VGRRGLAALAKKAEAEGAHLVLIDESGFFLNPLVRRTWAPVGQTPVLEGWGRHRDKVSALAALTVSPAQKRLGLYFATDPDDYLNNAGVADFLRGLLRHLRGKVIVVWDRGSNHKGGPIRDLLRRHPRLSVEWLPWYAPWLNPVEAVWAYLKYGLLANYVPEDVYDLDDTVTDHLINTRIEPELLEALWKGSELPRPTRNSQPSDQ
jgi:putative transposase